MLTAYYVEWNGSDQGPDQDQSGAGTVGPRTAVWNAARNRNGLDPHETPPHHNLTRRERDREPGGHLYHSAVGGGIGSGSLRYSVINVQAVSALRVGHFASQRQGV
jgi:hypothetical protein